MENDAYMKFDYSWLLAQCALDLAEAGLTWRSPLVCRWLGECGAPRPDWLDIDGILWILERLAIFIEDGGSSA